MQAEVQALAHQVALRFENGSAWRIAKDILKPRIPRFFYFSQYETLPGRIDVSKLVSTNQEPGQSGLQTARALLRLAGADQDVLTAQEFERRKAELEAVSTKLSREVFRYWTQNENLLVEIEADNAVQTDLERTAIVRYLDVRVRDTRHGYTGNFTQRSSGFQWFFSFLAAFSEFENRGHGVIVLLDEPALNLHGRAQADFLRFINERLAAKSQVIYATHSPFMVEPSHLERVRIVEDKGVEAGSVVSQDVSTVGADSLLPLQAALGHDIAQNLSLGPDNTLIEGKPDFTNLQTMREHLTSSEGNGQGGRGQTQRNRGWWRFWDRDRR
jgi:predicted ATPase